MTHAPVRILDGSELGMKATKRRFFLHSDAPRRGENEPETTNQSEPSKTLKASHLLS
jgi:hypothetical protein